MKVVKVDIARQQLMLFSNRTLLSTYHVSTAAKGVGETKGSWMTPRGWHTVRAKIGAGKAMGTVFKGRRPVGCYASMVHNHANNDWILSRILWLSGLEYGVNRLNGVDSMQRYIYIHGSPTPMDGVPRSMGCIRMQCEDVVALYDQLEVGDRVYIQATAQGE